MEENYQDLPAEEQAPKQSKNEKKLAKYKDDMDGINLEKETYANGINQDRSCTDFFCLIVFLAFVGTMVGLTGYTIAKGNINMMVAPVDTHLNLCGFGERADYQKLYFAYEGALDASEILDSGICMKTCPAKGSKISTDSVHPDDVTLIGHYNGYYSA